MEDIQKAVELAFEAFKERYGQDAKPKDGDTFVCVMNNCTLIVSLKEGFIGDKPLQVDHTLKIYGSEDK